MVASILSNSPVYSHLLSDIKLSSANSAGDVILHLKLAPHHLNSHKTLHGAVGATIVDFVGGPVIAAVASSRGTDVMEAKRGVSTDMSIQYLNAAKEGETLRIVARSKKAGRSLAWVGVQIWSSSADGQGKERLCVEGSHTKFVG